MNVARQFAKGGFDIVLVSRNREKLDKLSESLNFEGFNAQGFTADAAIAENLYSAFIASKNGMPILLSWSTTPRQ